MATMRAFIKERVVWIPLGTALLLNLLMWAYLGWQIEPTEELLILHYTIHFGVDFLGRWLSVFVVPLAGLLFGLVNVALMWWFWNRMRVLSYCTLAVTVVVQGALGGVALLLVALNT